MQITNLSFILFFYSQRLIVLEPYYNGRVRMPKKRMTVLDES